MNPEGPRSQPGAARRQGTVLESVEDVRAQIRASMAKTETEGTVLSAEDLAQEAEPFRPSLRPSMALLCVVDDGDDAGEMVRIRGGSFVIGRVEGDLIIPHDSGISGRHAEIVRRVENGESSWSLKDLQSTNGTFVRAATVILHHDQELLIGSRRFRFEMTALPPDPSPATAQDARGTRKWDAPTAAVVARAGSGAPTLVEISTGSAERRFPLTGQESWLGRDPRQCSIVVDDPMVDRRHARIYRDEKNGRWIIANARSRNGVWARIQEVGLGRGGCFQCGEQRFVLKVL